MIFRRFVCALLTLFRASGNLRIEIVRNGLAPSQSFPKLQFRVPLLNLYLFPSSCQPTTPQ